MTAQPKSPAFVSQKEKRGLVDGATFQGSSKRFSLTTEPLRTSTRTHSVHMAGPGKGNATDRDQTQLAAKPVGKTTS